MTNRIVRIMEVRGQADSLYIKGTVDGYDSSVSVEVAALEPLPNLAARREYVGQRMFTESQQRRQERYGALIGEFIIVTP